jgi:CO/xanthine dehydrogenase FAD-binding subunit
VYHQPTNLKEALNQLATPGARVVAGGTDFYPALGDALPDCDIVDLTRVEGLRGIETVQDGWLVGAATTWTDVIKADLPPAFDGLKAAARDVGSVQIQNSATVVGNVCNASPAADGVPPLLTLEAEVVLTGAGGVRRLPLGRFIEGPRKIALGPGEIVTGLFVPEVSQQATSAFLKLGSRRYLVISIAMVAVVLRNDAGRLRDVRVSVGACSAVAVRLTDLEAALEGVATDDLVRTDLVRPEHLSAVAPLDDVRGTASYRTDVAEELCLRALRQAAGVL